MTPARKRQLELLAQLEGTAATDAAEEPGGTLPTAPVDAPPMPRRPLVAAPAPVPLQPEVAPGPNELDPELAAARGEDVGAFNDRATETALRQIVAGITRTKAPDAVTQLGTGEKDLLGRRRQAQVDALRQLEAGNNAARTEAYVKSNEAAGKRAEAGGERADRKLELDQTEAGRRDARFEAEQALKTADLERKKAADAAKAKRGSGKAPPARDAKGNLLPATYRDQLRGNALQPRDGWEPINADKPTFRDQAQGTNFDNLVATYGALGNHKAHAMEAINRFRNAKTPTEGDTALGEANAQMLALANKLRTAEGLNNSDAANAAIEQMLTLEHGSIANFRNLVNSGRIEAILNAGLQSAGANLDTTAKSINLRRSKGAAASAPAPAGTVTVTNGKETREIDEGDLADAEKDGYRRVGK